MRAVPIFQANEFPVVGALKAHHRAHEIIAEDFGDNLVGSFDLWVTAGLGAGVTFEDIAGVRISAHSAQQSIS
ncbi:hypothetical protein GCM10027157_04160 [Corynebacterium aquatimens]